MPQEVFICNRYALLAMHTFFLYTSFMSAIQNSLSLMQDSARRFDLASHNLANINTPDFQAIRPDGKEKELDLGEQIVETIQSSGAYKLGVKTLEIAQDMQKSLIDIRA